MAVMVFLAFALAYFLSALLRAVTATLAPTLGQEFALSASDLGLLAGSYFLGFSAVQLPLGKWLDRHGPRRVALGFLGVAVLGCLVFSWADSFAWLLLGRALCGVGVGACLMAPLTGYRRWLNVRSQLRANSWMLMTGSLGMVASTLPVQWLLPQIGWRPLFWGLAACVVLAMGVIALCVPAWEKAPQPQAGGPGADSGYAAIWRNAYFWRLAPLGFISYGGMVAVQTLWAGPWMVRVAGDTPLAAATGLFMINVCMLTSFWLWGLLTPWLLQRFGSVDRLMLVGVPLSLCVLAGVVYGGAEAGAAALALYCVCCTVVSLAQPAVARAFAPAYAGRALSAFNLVIFSGVFVMQWSIGLLVDGFAAAGWEPVQAFQGAMGVFWLASAAAYAWFVWRGQTARHNAVPPTAAS